MERYNIKRFDENISIFDKEKWRKFLPKKVKLVTSNGNFELVQTDLTINIDVIQVVYYQKTFNSPNDVNKDGEPDTLEFDIHTVKNNDGTQANPDTLKLNIDVSYGDSMVSAFTIEKPGQIKVSHYTGLNSKYDKDTQFGFDDDTLEELVVFFNRFGFKLNKKDFSFLDKYPDSYSYIESVKLLPLFNDNFILVVNNNKAAETKYLENMLNYLRNRGIVYKVASSKEEVIKNNSDGIIGCISTGSNYMISNPESDEVNASQEALNLSCPILGLGYGMQSLAKSNGSIVKSLVNKQNDNIILGEYSSKHSLFKGINLNDTQVSFSFNDYLEDCPDGFEIICKLPDNKIAGISNDYKKHYGFLFHPEDIENTQVILDNFIDICKSNINKEIDNNLNSMKYLQTYESFKKIN